MSTPSLITWLGFAVSVVLPIIVALVTKQTANPGLKAVVLLALSAVTGFGSSWLDALNGGTSFSMGTATVSALLSFAIGVLSHFGILRGLGVTGSQGAVATKFPGGLG